jgi:hypothetical protein
MSGTAPSKGAQSHQPQAPERQASDPVKQLVLQFQAILINRKAAP